MAITLPTIHIEQQERRIKPGEAVMDDSANDLESLNQQIARNFAADVRILAQGGNTSTITSPVGFTALWSFPIKLWSADASVRLHIFAEQTDVALVVDLTAISVLSKGAGQGLASSAVFKLSTSGVTLDGDGTVLVLLSVRENFGSGTRNITWWCLEEVPVAVGDMPDSTHADTGFITTDDEPWDRNVPLNSGFGQQLRENSKIILNTRTRGTATVYPRREQDAAYFVSSSYHRCFGPYVLEASPWASSAEVVLLVRTVDDGVSDDDVAFSIMSEHETIEIMLDRTQVVSTTGVDTTLKFTGIKVQSDPYTTRTNKIWLVVKSKIDVDEVIASSVVVLASPQSGSWVTVTNPIPTEGPEPHGRVAVQQAYSQVETTYPGSKPTFDTVKGEGTWDIAGSEVDVAGNNTIHLSPNPFIKDLFRTDYNNTPVFDVVAMGIGQILGVWVNEASSLTELDKSFRQLALPSASVVARSRNACNDATRYGVAQIGMAHMGQVRQIDAPDYLADPINPQLGKHVFVHTRAIPNVTDFIDVSTWMLPVDPNPGGGSGTSETEVVLAQALYMMTRGRFRNTRIVDEGIDWRLGLSTIPTFEATPGIAVGATETVTANIYWEEDINRSFTAYDADAASRIVSRHGGITPAFDVSHGFTTQCTWPEEAIGGHIWLKSPIVKVAVESGGYPMFAKLQARNNITAGTAVIIISTAWCWYGRRFKLP